MDDKVSIVTVCFNAVNTIENTILSIINQTYNNIEYIIIDGGSRDGTVDVINKYRDNIAYFVSEPDRGIYDAMNKGIMAATGKWINFMNAGDSFFSERSVESFVSQIDTNTIIAYGDTMMIYSFTSMLKTPYPIHTILDRMPFGHQATFINTDYHKMHIFDLSFISSSDYKFFYDSYKRGVKFQYIPLTVANYEAESGVSSTNFFIVNKELAIIQGKYNLLWRIQFLFKYASHSTKQSIKKILPQRLVNNIKLKHLKKLNTNNYED